MPLHPSEIEFRRRWYEAHVRHFESDPVRVQAEADVWDGFVRSAPEALGHLEALRRTRDLEAFRAAMQTWAVKSDTLAFNGFAGQMLLNQLVKRSDDPYRLGALLADCLTAPADDDEAAAKIRVLVDHIEAIRAGGQPAPRSAAFLLSYLWRLADRQWPIQWASAAAFAEYICGTPLPSVTDERYREFCVRVRELDRDGERFERTAAWWDREHPVFVDPVLADRCAFGEHAAGMDYDDLARNAAALTAFARHTRGLAADVGEAAGRPLRGRAPGLDWKEGRPRSDAWVDWTDGRAAPGIRVWINHRGLAIGVKPGLVRPGWYDEAAVAIEKTPTPGFRLFAARGGQHGEDVGFTGGASGEFLYGRFFDRDRLAEIDLREEVVAATSAARPTLDALTALARGEERPPPDLVVADPLVAQEGATEEQTDPIADLSEELLLDRSFLDEVIELLEDKGQIILYGPPGTGKTYIAKKLAEMLAPDPRRRSIVQFHPSTSYEDFVEGYRPQTVNGTIAHALTDGPLRTLADRAKDAPGTRHVMLIDEINRGNLPKILGELLFLLEYRDEQIGTLYRPDEAFALPSDLWFIGTMNTADRSVALIDAALRRRFHFIPIYPDSGPLEGLLHRWLERNGEPAWVADLVTMANADLVKALGGAHLQIGPSHFMRRGLDEARVERIWRYNVEPFVEDQFFGDQSRIERFRYSEVRRRHRELAGEVAGTEPDVEQ